MFIESQNYKENLGLNKQNIYINAGVLLLNLKKFRQDNICELLMNNTNKFQNIIKYQDQDIITG